MKGPPFAIDHLMVRVPDSEAAGASFEALGFTVTPRSLLPGLSNRLVCFPTEDERAAAFIELISIDDAAAAPEPVVDLLGARHGPAAIVVATEDAEGLARSLAPLSDILPPRELSRNWDLGDRTLTLAFSVLIARRRSAPLAWSAIQHRTPEHYRDLQFVTHPAGTFRLHALLAVAPEPLETATQLAKLWGTQTVNVSKEVVVIRLGLRELRICSWDRLFRNYGEKVDTSAAMVGVVLQTSDPSEVVQRIAKSDASTPLRGNAIRVGAESWSCLVVLETLNCRT